MNIRKKVIAICLLLGANNAFAADDCKPESISSGAQSTSVTPFVTFTLGERTLNILPCGREDTVVRLNTSALVDRAKASSVVKAASFADSDYDYSVEEVDSRNSGGHAYSYYFSARFKEAQPLLDDQGTLEALLAYADSHGAAAKQLSAQGGE